MEWMTDPAAWFGLLTLVVLEIVLGIDNLVFIAIVADKLPRERRDHARRLGLVLALAMRLGLLAGISWVMSLGDPLFAVRSLEFSWRDLILIAGGVFLLVKATIEIHDRLEATPFQHAAPTVHAAFWPTVAQIVVLDAVFSLDSIVTAVGMVDELALMMIAVVIAVGTMLVASAPLSAFVNRHPSLVILCLGFLLMVGLVLVVDGFGYHLPKGYLYAAIGFSVLIETLNQLALRNRRRMAAAMPRRQRAADAILRLLGGVPLPMSTAVPNDEGGLLSEGAKEPAFAPAEKEMVRGVLTLADRPVRTIMTPRFEVEWLDPADPGPAVVARLRASPHRVFLVSRGTVDEVAGIARKDEILELCLGVRPFDLTQAVREPLAVHECTSILNTLEAFKREPVDMALVVDEYGGLQGIVTQTDVLEAIAGDLPEGPDDAPDVQVLDDGSFLVDGATSLYDAQERLGLVSRPAGDFHTVAGLVLALFGRIPKPGEHVHWCDWRFEVSEMDGWRVSKVRAKRATPGRTSAAEASPGAVSAA